MARSAQLAMLLEVYASPKPGNVDRTHDRGNTRYEHFLASSVAVYPVLREASMVEKGMGKLIRRAVEESMKWQNGGNVHFGSILLIIPLVMAAGISKGYEEIKKKAKEFVLNSSVEDAIELYKAFSRAKVKVKEVKELSVLDKNSLQEIREKRLTFYDILTLSASYDLISKELVEGFEKSFRYAEIIKDFVKRSNMSINDAIVCAFLTLLSEEEDTFVKMEFGSKKSKYVMDRAKNLIEKGYNSNRKEVEELDKELLKAGINPGTTADIIVAALFLAIINGLRF